MSETNPVRSIVDVIRRNAGEFPTRRIFTFLGDGENETATLTYGEIDTQARAVAVGLQARADPGTRVILIFPPGLENITAMLACFYAGMVFVPSLPVTPNRPPDTLLGVIADTDARFVLTTQAMRASLQSTIEAYSTWRAPEWIAFEELVRDCSAEDWSAPLLNEQSGAALLYTSGSTKAARGITIAHGDLINTIKRMKYGKDPGAASVTVTWKPLYHGSGMGDMFLYPLVGKAPIVILPTQAFLERPFVWLQAVSRYRATKSGGPNFGYQLCVDKVSEEERATLDLSAWQMASVGNEPIQARTLEAFAELFAPCGFRREAFFIGYGLTEGTMGVSAKRDLETRTLDRAALEENRVVFAAPEDAAATRVVNCGEPTPGAQVHIVDPATKMVCAPDRVGEIWVASDYAFQGYWNKPEETAQVFRAYLADTGGGPFLRTGDMGFMHDGALYITGRLKDMIILRGRNLYSEDIEQVAGRAHPALMPGAAAAFSIPVQGQEQLAIIHEVKTSAHNVNVDQVAQAIRRAIAREMQLPVQAVVLVKEASLPRTPSGKIQRYLCRAQLLASEQAAG